MDIGFIEDIKSNLINLISYFLLHLLSESNVSVVPIYFNQH